MQTIDASGKRRVIGLLAAVSSLLLVAAFAAASAGAAQAPEMGAVTPSYGSAHVTGTVHSEGFFTPWTFEYSTDDATWIEGPGGGVFSPLTVPVERDITGLKGGTKYFVRLVASGIPSPGPDPEFTTLAVDPPAVLAVDNASEVEYTTVKLSGAVSRPANSDPAFDANCNFEYVTDEQFVSTEFEGATLVGCGPENPVHTAGASQVEAVATGLEPGTKYHLRLSVSNPGGRDSKVAAATFTTLVHWRNRAWSRSRTRPKSNTRPPRSAE